MDGPIALELHPTTVPEWDAEELAFGDLADDVTTISADEAKVLFDKVLLEFPRAVPINDLLAFAASRATPLDQPIVADTDAHDYVLMELPVTILVPDGRRLVRLQVILDATTSGTEPVTAWDLFPSDTYHQVTHDLGTASVDVTKALTFLSPLVGDVLGLKLSVPLKWTSEYVSVRCSDRMSNPVRWDLTDDTISHGFTGYVIWRVPKGASVSVTASLLGEIRSDTLFGRHKKGQFRTAEHTYPLM